jgi:hypothetical protein
MLPHCTTCIIHLPLRPKNQLYQIIDEIVQAVGHREYLLQHSLDVADCADHELVGVGLGIEWDHSESRTAFANGHQFDVTEREEFEKDCEHWDIEVTKALDALAAKNWRGHLFANVMMKGKVCERYEFEEKSERWEERRGKWKWGRKLYR